MHCGVAVQAPEYVSKAKLAWFGSHSRPEACVPLIGEAVASHDQASVHDMESQCITVTRNSYVHGVCFKDFTTLDRCVCGVAFITAGFSGFPELFIYFKYFKPI